MLNRRGFFGALFGGLLGAVGLRKTEDVPTMQWSSCWGTKTTTSDTSVTYWTTSDPARFRGRRVCRFDPPDADDERVWMKVDGPHPLSKYPPEPECQREWDAMERGEA